MLLPSGPDMVRGLYCTGPEARQGSQGRRVMLRHPICRHKRQKSLSACQHFISRQLSWNAEVL